MEIYVLIIIPVLCIQSVFGQGVEFPYITTPHTAKTDTLLSVICTLTIDTPSAQDAQFKWLDKNGAQITNRESSVSPYLRDYSAGGKKGIIMLIGKVSDDDAGTYKCQAVVNQQTYEKEFVLNVKASLQFRDCPQNQFGVLGKESLIRCTADAGGILVQTSWEKDGTVVDASNRIQFEDTAMRILNTTDSDAGVYRYTAMTLTAGSESDLVEISFDVYTAPVIVAPILQTTAIVGKEASMYCKARGKPDPVIEWRKEGTTNVLETTDRIIVSQKKEGDDIQGILQFKNVIKDDRGNYSCYAKNVATDENMASVAQTANRLIVQTPPTIKNMSNMEFREGGPGSLVCEAYGDPIPKMVWENVRSGERYSVGTSAEGKTVNKEDIPDDNNPGARLTLSFASVKHSDAGEYKCEAVNDAAIAEQIVKLGVRYSPNFDEQTETTFYNWLGNNEAYIDCYILSNPEPVVFWYKGTRQITDADSFFGITTSADVDPENPHRTVSKLKVKYNGANDDAVFGVYTCEAKNAIGENNITLTMQKAVPPAQPEVDVQDFDARHFRFWFMDQAVQGPDVTHYKVVYKQQGSSEDAKEQMVAKEVRTHIDTSRRYTEMIVNDLQPDTMYVWTFYAVSPVGTSSPVEMTRGTPAISVPDMPVISTQINSPYSDRINVVWNVPSDGGAVILKYSLTYQRVNVKNGTDPTKGYELLSVIDSETREDNIKDPGFTLSNLLPGQFYNIKVYAHNSKGPSSPGTKIIRTAIAELAPGASTGKSDGLSTGAIIGIVIGIFFLLFIIVDVTCYFKNDCGILMTVREKVAGSREEGYAVAKTEDAENLPKKDELTEEAKAAEEGDLAEQGEDEKKEPLLSSEEQKVETVDEVDKKPEEKELEPEEKETIKTGEQKSESPKSEQQPPAESPKEEKPAESQPSDKPQE